MGKFQFYHINEHYISYLHSIDTRVQYNKGQRRPFTLTSKAAVLL